MSRGSAHVATAQLIRDGLQYELHVTATADGGSELVAVPRAIRNGQDISDQPVWILDGKYGQRPRWQRLFNETRKMLGLPAVVPPAPPPSKT